MKKNKYRFILDFEKEERWINEMSEQGWQLEKFILGLFTFTKGKPGEYIYRNEYLMDKNKKEREAYKHFLEESGIEVVHESFAWIYTRKKAIEGNYEIFSDITSKRKYYEKLLYTFGLLFLINAFLSISNLTYLRKMADASWLNVGAGFIGLLACIVLLIPLRIIWKHKQQLAKEEQFFE